MVTKRKIASPLSLREKKVSEKEKSFRKQKRKLSSIYDDKERIVRDVCAKRLLPKSQESNKDKREVTIFASEYSRKYASYTKSRMFDWRKAEKEGTFSLILCGRAVAQANMLKASYRDYIEAQFYWFNDYYQRAPYLGEIASAGALVRYQAWKELREGRQISDDVVHPAKIVTKINTLDTTDDTIIKYETAVLKRMIRNWGSEEEVWMLCGTPGDEEVFSDSFKRTREVWRNMYE